MIVRLFAVGVLFSSQLFAADCPLTNGKYVTMQKGFGDAYIRGRPDGVGGCKVHLQIGAGHWYFTSKNQTRWEFAWNYIDIKSENGFYLDVREGPEQVPYTLADASQLPSPRFNSPSTWRRILQHYNSEDVDLFDQLRGEYNAGEIVFHIKGKPHEYFEIEDNRRIVFNRPWMSTGLKIPPGEFHYDIKGCLKSRPKDCDRLSLTFEIVD